MKKEFFKEFSDISDSVFVVTNINGKVEYANDVFCKILQLDKEELIGNNLKDFFTETEKKEADELINDLKNNNKNIEEKFTTEVITKNGEKRIIQGKNSYIKDENGNFRYVVTSGEDITEYKKLLVEKEKTIEELKAYKEKLTLALENGNTVIWEWDPKNNVIFFSENIKNLGISFEDEKNVKYSSWVERIAEDDKENKSKKIDNYILNKNDNYECEYRVKRDDGEYIWVLSRGKAVKSNNGFFIKIIGTLNDITKQKNSEHMMKKKKDFFKMISEYDKYILTESDEDTLLNKTAEFIRNIGNYKYSAIAYIKEDKDKTFDIKSSLGFDEKIIEKYRFSYDKKSDQYISLGVCINSGKTEMFKKGTKLSIWKKESETLGYSVSISVPLKVFGKIIGALAIYSDDENDFHPDFVKILEQMVTNLDLAIERIRKDKEIKNKSQQNEKILNSITDCVILMDKDLNIKWANEASKKVIPDMVGNKCYTATLKSSVPCKECIVQKSIKSGKVEKTLLKNSYIEDGVKKDYYWEDIAIPIENEKGKITEIVEFSRNVTEIIESKRKIEHIANILKVVQESERLIIQEKDKKELATKICSKLLSTREYKDSWIILFDENMNPDYIYFSNKKSNYKKLSENLKNKKYPKCIEKAIELKKSFFVINPEKDCSDCIIYDNYKNFTAVSIPISHKERIFGILNLSVKSDFFKNIEEQNLLLGIASELGYGLNYLEKQDRLTSSEKEKKLAYLKIKANQEILIKSLGKVVEMRDPYTSGHQRRVAELTIEIAKNMNLSEERTDAVKIASLLHDIGKIYVPTEILNKAGKLSNLEFKMIKEHSQYGFELLKGLEFDFPVSEFVLQHHERIDGSGYPNGSKSDETYLESKIIAVADVVEAISSHRPYRPALGLETALEEIKNNSGKLYETEVVNACLKAFEKGFEFKEQ